MLSLREKPCTLPPPFWIEAALMKFPLPNSPFVLPLLVPCPKRHLNCSKIVPLFKARLQRRRRLNGKRRKAPTQMTGGLFWKTSALRRKLGVPPKIQFQEEDEDPGPVFHSIYVPSTDPSTESFVEEFFSRLEGAGATTTDSSPASSDAGRGGSDVEDGGGDRRSSHPSAGASVPALLGRPVEFSLRLPDWPPREVEQYDLGLRVAAPADPLAGEKERQGNYFSTIRKRIYF